MAKKKREDWPEYHAFKAHLLHCVPVNFENAKSRPGTVIAMAAGTSGEIGHWAIDLSDTRKLVTGLLVSLATYDDELAKLILDERFVSDGEGKFKWPDES